MVVLLPDVVAYLMRWGDRGAVASAIVDLVILRQGNYVESTADGCELYWAVFGEILLLLRFSSSRPYL
jgi:hypothetical protein